MPNQAVITLTDIRGVAYESDPIDIRQYIIDHHSNTYMTERQQMDYIKNTLWAKYSFASDAQEILININGVETYFNPEHIISISFNFI